MSWFKSIVASLLPHDVFDVFDYNVISATCNYSIMHLGSQHGKEYLKQSLWTFKLVQWKHSIHSAKVREWNSLSRYVGKNQRKSN